MIFRQLHDAVSGTYTYLLADKATGKAVLIDPVMEKTDDYIKLIRQLGLTLEYVMDTHTHADHITAMGKLREQTGCKTLIGQQANVDCVSETFVEGDTITVGQVKLEVIHTPGHTGDSYSFYTVVEEQPMLFTGDTLLIRGTGRTDFPGGDAKLQYHSIFEKLLNYPGNTLVYPGHDYKGWTVSTLAEEKQYNPRLQVQSVQEYESIMGNLNLDKPKMMEIAIPANQACGNPDIKLEER